MSLYDSSLVNHIITNRHSEDINIYHFQQNKKRPLHTLNLCYSACSESENRSFYQGMQKFMRGKRSPSHPITEGVLQLSMAVFSTSVQWSAAVKYIWGRRDKEGGLCLKTWTHFKKGKCGKKTELTETYCTVCSGWGTMKEESELPRIREGGSVAKVKREALLVACFQLLSFSTSQVKHCCSSNFTLMHRAQRVFKVS